jgi:hypothetical protein
MYNKLPVKERIELMKSYRKANKDMSYRDMVKDYNDSYEKFRDGGKSDGMTGLMKSKIATEAHYGNPAALRMVSPNPNKYTFTGKEKDWKGNQASPAGSSGTHFMGSYGDQARPGLQEVNGKMQYFQNPPRNSKENFNFSRPEDAEYFAKHYKEVAPMMRNWEKHKYGGIQQFDNGGKKSVNNNLLSTTVRNDNMLYNNGQSFLNRGMQIEHYPNGVNDTLYSYTRQLPGGEFENFNSSTGHLNSPAFNQLYKNGQFSTLPSNQSTEYQNNILNYFQKINK